MVLRAVWAVVRGRRRDLRRDAKELMDGMKPQPIVTGVGNVPGSGSCVLLPNHYERRTGVWVGWGAITITGALCRHRGPGAAIRWVMTSSWEDCYIGPRRIAPEHVQWVLRKLASLYGIILMSPEPGRTQSRGHTLREIFHTLDDPRGHIVALHPEAGGFEELIEPPRGIGRVLAAIEERHVPMFPVAVFEERGRIRVHFGSPLPANCLGGRSDGEAAAAVMLTIARMVPAKMRGPYSETTATDDTTMGAGTAAEPAAPR
jgi:hypothetical protein